MSTKEGCLPRGCLPRRGVCLGGVCLGGVSAWGVSAQGVSVQVECVCLGGGVCLGGVSAWGESVQGRGCLPRERGCLSRGRECLPGGVSLGGCLPITYCEITPQPCEQNDRQCKTLLQTFVGGKDLCDGCVLFQINNLQRTLLLVFPKEKIERSRKPTTPLAR